MQNSPRKTLKLRNSPSLRLGPFDGTVVDNFIGIEKFFGVRATLEVNSSVLALFCSVVLLGSKKTAVFSNGPE